MRIYPPGCFTEVNKHLYPCGITIQIMYFVKYFIHSVFKKVLSRGCGKT